MKLGVLTVLLGDLPFEEALDYLRDLGIQAVEIGCGNYPGNAHCDPDALLNDDKACDAFLNAVTSRDIEICALAAHGNPLHPNPKIARAHIETQRKTIQLAHKLGVQTVVGFSRLPRRFRRLQVSQLGYVPLAGRLPGDSGVAVGAEGHPVLEGRSRLPARAQCPHRPGDAPRLCGLQLRDLPATPRCLRP